MINTFKKWSSEIKLALMNILLIYAVHEKTGISIDMPDVILNNDLIVVCTGIVLSFISFLGYFIYKKVQRIDEMTQYFHWIYNYRFELMMNEKGEDKFRFFTDVEWKFMINKMHEKWTYLNRKDIDNRLKGHYSKFYNSHTNT